MNRPFSQPIFLLVNPPIYDFAAYDLWAKPLGLLAIASQLMDAGAKVQLIDCCDRYHPALPPAVSDDWGCGKYIAQEVQKPGILRSIPRRYKRYGMPADVLDRELRRIAPPDAVLVSSGMTYWYPGVFEIIARIREVFPKALIILGGVYATLCPEHAKTIPGVDHVIAGPGTGPLLRLLKERCLIPIDVDEAENFPDSPLPAYGLYRQLPYAVLRTTRGCPFRCSYCAIEAFAPGKWERKPPEKVAAEIKTLHEQGVQNIAFYDDSLFVNSEEHILPLLARVRELGIKAFFHSPNGLHARYLSPSLARALKSSGFIMPRLSLESAEPQVQQSTGGKVTNEEFLRAAALLKEAGYKPGEFAAYLILGMPEQDLAVLEKSIRFAHTAGARVLLAEYSPIPGTRDWQKVEKLLPSSDPLWQNNSLFPLYPMESWPKLSRLKEFARKLNRCFT